MNIKILVCFFVISALTGCGISNISDAKKAVEQQLKDPDSVQYRNVSSFESNVVCGEFNSKNSMGGYVGYKKFTYNAPVANELDIEPSPLKLQVWCTSYSRKAELVQKLCSDYKEKPNEYINTKRDLGC